VSTKKVTVDFADKKLDIDVPDHATVVEFEDPPFLPDPAQAVRDTLSKPYNSAPLSELAKPGMRVAIGFDDITRPNTPPRTILPIIVEELLKKGVKQRDILFINASSNHRKNTRAELANHLGPEIFRNFWGTGQILNHDCTDQEQLTYFGITDGGRYVEMNKHFVDADLMIYQGNVSAGAFRSYTGTGVAVGLASTRSIASHHSFHGIPEPSIKPKADKSAAAAPRKRIASVKEEMTDFLDEALGKKVFYINSSMAAGGAWQASLLVPLMV
jgi:lactate racemase